MSKYKRYERYKDSGVEWIGEMPEHWKKMSLKMLASNEKNSFVDGPFGSDLKNEEYQDDGIPLIQLNNIVDGKHILQNLKFISEEKAQELCRHIIYPNDIVIAKMAYPVARAARVNEEYDKYVIVADCVKLKPNITKCDIRFLVYVINCPYVRSQAEIVASGTTRLRISLGSLRNLQVFLPTLNEQKSIADYLDQKTAEMDSLIADKEKLIELLQEKRQAIITEAVTKGLNPNVKMKDSGIEWIGEIPEHWRLSKIKYESLINNKTLSESTDDDYEIDYIDISSVTSIGEIDGVQSLNFKDAPSRARRILYKGDTIVSTVRTYLKAIAFIENVQSNLICSTGFAVLTPLSKVVPKYLFYLMRSEKYVNEIVRRSVGVSYPAINASDIGALECAIPNKDEQKYIVEYLDNCTTQIDQLVNDIQTQIQKLKEYRQSLISEAVTGKIDVREFGNKSEVIYYEQNNSPCSEFTYVAE